MIFYVLCVYVDCLWVFDKLIVSALSQSVPALI